MATPTIRESLSAAASGTSATVTTGAGTQVNDVLVCFFGNDYYTAAGMGSPTGTAGTWTLQATGDNGSLSAHVKVFTRAVTVGGAQSVTVAPVTDEEVYLSVIVLAGADTSSPADGAAGGNGAASTSHVAPAVLPATSDALLLCCAQSTSGGGSASYTPPAGMTERTDVNDGSFAAESVASLVLAASGSTGTQTFTFSASGASSTYATASIAVKGAAATSIPYNPQRATQTRDQGQAWWLQRDRRDANTVGSAANPLPPPLDSAWQAAGRYWHLYGDAADAAPRTWQSLQRNYTSDPSLLSSTSADPLLVGAGVGGDEWRRYNLAAFSDRREVPQQRAYVSDPTLLAAALLENELLGGADDLRRRANLAATHADRREVPQQPARATVYFDAGPDSPPLTLSWGAGGRYWALYNQAGWQPDRRKVPQQRLYISDPSSYPTVPPTDPLTVAWGDGGTYWLLYNTAALQVSRRHVPQQRLYVSDPALLTSALLENELLGGADDIQRHRAVFSDRRVTVSVPGKPDPALLLPPADPLLVAGGVGSDGWRRYATPVTHATRRLVPAQPNRWTVYVDVVLVANATSTPTVVALVTSTTSVGRSGTSTTSVGRSATSTATVSDG